MLYTCAIFYLSIVLLRSMICMLFRICGYYEQSSNLYNWANECDQMKHPFLICPSVVLLFLDGYWFPSSWVTAPLISMIAVWVSTPSRYRGAFLLLHIVAIMSCHLFYWSYTFWRVQYEISKIFWFSLVAKDNKVFASSRSLSVVFRVAYVKHIIYGKR